MLELQKFDAVYGSSKKLNPLIFELKNTELPNNLNLFFTAKPVEENQTETKRNIVYVKLTNSTTNKSVKYKFNRPSIVCSEDYEETINVKLIDDYNVSRGDKIIVEISSTDYSNILLNKPETNKNNLLMGECETIVDWGDFVMGNWNNVCLMNQIKFPSENLIPNFTANLPYGFLNLNPLNNSWFSSRVLSSPEIKNLSGDVRGFFMLEPKYEESYVGFTGIYLTNYLKDNAPKLKNLSDYFNGRKTLGGTFVVSYLLDAKFKPTKIDRMFANNEHPYGFLPEFDLSECESADGFMMNNINFNLTIDETIFKNTNYIKSIDGMFAGCTSFNKYLFSQTMNFNGLTSARDLTLNSDINPIFNDLFIMRNLVNNTKMVDLTNIDLTILGETNLKNKAKYNQATWDNYTVQKPTIIEYNNIFNDTTFGYTESDNTKNNNYWYFSYPKEDNTYTYDNYNTQNTKDLLNLVNGKSTIHVWGRIDELDLLGTIPEKRGQLSMELTDVFRWNNLRFIKYINLHTIDFTNMKINDKQTELNSFFRDNIKLTNLIDFDKNVNNIVTNLSTMFYRCFDFNQPLNFNSINVTNFESLLGYCSKFNSEINIKCDSGKIFNSFLEGCSSFNKPLPKTNRSINDKEFDKVLMDCSVFNQHVKEFLTGKIRKFERGMYGLKVYNRDISFIKFSENITELNSCFYLPEYTGEWWDVRAIKDLTNLKTIMGLYNTSNTRVGKPLKYTSLISTSNIEIIFPPRITMVVGLFGNHFNLPTKHVKLDFSNLNGVVDLYNTFYNNDIFNGNINILGDKVRRISRLLDNNKSFNLPISLSLLNCESINTFIINCESFNNTIGLTTNSKLVEVASIVTKCFNFNQSINNIISDMSGVTSLTNIISECPNFNKPIDLRNKPNKVAKYGYGTSSTVGLIGGETSVDKYGMNKFDNEIYYYINKDIPVIELPSFIGTHKVNGLWLGEYVDESMEFGYEDLNPIYADMCLESLYNQMGNNQQLKLGVAVDNKGGFIMKLTSKGMKLARKMVNESKFVGITEANINQHFIEQKPMIFDVDKLTGTDKYGTIYNNSQRSLIMIEHEGVYYEPYNGWVSSNPANNTYNPKLPKTDTPTQIKFWGKTYTFAMNYNRFNPSNSEELRLNTTKVVTGNVIRKGGVINFGEMPKLTEIDLSTIPNMNDEVKPHSLFDQAYKLTKVVGLNELLSTANDLQYLLRRCDSFNQEITVKKSKYNEHLSPNATSMMDSCYSFDKPITIELSITYAERMLGSMTKFNQTINNINFTKVVNASNLLVGNSLYNQKVDFSKFNPTVTRLDYFFNGCKKYNQITDTSMLNEVTNYTNFLGYCVEFNSTLKLNLTSTININNLLRGCLKFNQPFIYNKPNNIVNMIGVFHDCIEMTSDIDLYTNNVTNLSYFLYNAVKYNKIPKLSDTSKVVDFEGFLGCNGSTYGNGIFNQKLVLNTDSAKNLSKFFINQVMFNQKSEFSNTSKVDNFSEMYSGCISYNQKDNYDTSSAKNVNAMFANSKVNDSFTHYNLVNVTTAKSMFFGCTELDSNIEFSLPKCSTIQSMFDSSNMNKSTLKLTNLNEVTDAISFLNGSNYDNDLVLDLPKCTNMYESFKNMKSLGKRKWRITAPIATLIHNGFMYNENMDLDLILDTPKITTYYQLFSYCYKQKQKLSINVTSTTTLSNTFRDCYELESIEFLGKNGNNHGDLITSVSYLFSNTYKLKEIINNIRDYSKIYNRGFEYMLAYYDSKGESNLEPKYYDEILENIYKTLNRNMNKNIRFYADGRVYTSKGSVFRQSLIDDMGWIFTGDILQPNPNLLNRGLEVDDVIIDDSDNLIIVDWDAKYATSPFIKYDVKNKYVLSKTSTSGSDFRICGYDENFNLIGNRLYVGSDVYVLPFGNESIKYIRVSYQKSSNPKLEIGTIVTPHIEDWIPRQNIIEPSDIITILSNNQTASPISYQPLTNGDVKYSRVTPTTQTAKRLSLYSMGGVNLTHFRLMSLLFENKYLIVSFDIKFEGNGVKYLRYSADIRGINGKTYTNPVKYIKCSTNIGWQRVYITIPLLDFNPHNFRDSLRSVIGMNVYNSTNPEDYATDIEPNQHFLYTKNFKIEAVDNPDDKPTPYIKTDIVDAPNMLNPSNDFISNYTRFGGSEITMINPNYVVEEWGAIDAKHLRIKGGSETIMAILHMAGLTYSTPYTYMVWIENKSTKWVNLSCGFLEKTPESSQTNSVNQWVAPNEKTMIVLKGWTRANNFNFSRLRSIQCSNTQGGAFLIGATVDVVLWREKFYEGHEDSIWTKHPDE